MTNVDLINAAFAARNEGRSIEITAHTGFTLGSFYVSIEIRHENDSVAYHRGRSVTPTEAANLLGLA